MYCPEHILINKSCFMLTLYGDSDIPWEFVPMRWKLNPLRYELILRRPKFVRINEDGYLNRIWNNFLYKHIRPKLCKWFGIHQKFDIGNKKRCHHCGLGK